MTTETLSPVQPPARPVLVALAAIALYWLAELAAQVGAMGPGGAIAVRGLQAALSQSAVVVVGLILGHALVGRMDLALRSITLVFLLGALLNLAVWTAFRVTPGLVQTEAGWRALQSLVHLPQVAVLVWLLRTHPRRWVLSGVVMMAAFLGTQEVVARHFRVGELYEVAGNAGRVPPVDVEALYAAQEPLMAAQVAALAPQVPGVPEIYGLFLGGTADQSVFLSELEAAAGIVGGHFGAETRSLRLANSVTAPTRYPMANRANLARALAEIGARKGPEDVAFLYLTSHGHKNRISFSFAEAGTSDLMAGEFARMLDDSRIGSAVIVLSACFSGSFLDDIAAPDRLVITAARADRASFGCRDGAEWTEFGRSFFDLALRADPDPRRAFDLAVADVARKETTRGLLHSLPQISEGPEIGRALDRLLAVGKTAVVPVD